MLHEGRPNELWATNIQIPSCEQRTNASLQTPIVANVEVFDLSRARQMTRCGVNPANGCLGVAY